MINDKIVEIEESNQLDRLTKRAKSEERKRTLVGLLWGTAGTAFAFASYQAFGSEEVPVGIIGSAVAAFSYVNAYANLRQRPYSKLVTEK